MDEAIARQRMPGGLLTPVAPSHLQLSLTGREQARPVHARRSHDPVSRIRVMIAPSALASRRSGRLRNTRCRMDAVELPSSYGELLLEWGGSPA